MTKIEIHLNLLIFYWKYLITRKILRVKDQTKIIRKRLTKTEHTKINSDEYSLILDFMSFFEELTHIMQTVDFRRHLDKIKRDHKNILFDNASVNLKLKLNIFYLFDSEYFLDEIDDDNLLKAYEYLIDGINLWNLLFDHEFTNEISKIFYLIKYHNDTESRINESDFLEVKDFFYLFSLNLDKISFYIRKNFTMGLFLIYFENEDVYNKNLIELISRIPQNEKEEFMEIYGDRINLNTSNDEYIRQTDVCRYLESRGVDLNDIFLRKNYLEGF